MSDPLADVIQEANLEWVDGHLPRHKFVTAAVKAHIASVLTAEYEGWFGRTDGAEGARIAIANLRAALLPPTEEPT